MTYSVLNKPPLAMMSPSLCPEWQAPIYIVFGKGGHCPDICPGEGQGNGARCHHIHGTKYKDLALPLPSSQRPAPFASTLLSVSGFNDKHSHPEYSSTRRALSTLLASGLCLKIQRGKQRGISFNSGLYPLRQATSPCLSLWQSPVGFELEGSWSLLSSHGPL